MPRTLATAVDLVVCPIICQRSDYVNSAYIQELSAHFQGESHCLLKIRLVKALFFFLFSGFSDKMS
jgi:hypothetical protein